MQLIDCNHWNRRQILGRTVYLSFAGHHNRNENYSKQYKTKGLTAVLSNLFDPTGRTGIDFEATGWNSKLQNSD